MAQYDTTWFEKGLAELEITLNEKQIEQFLTYYELLVEWNKVMNLTAITEYEEVITKHFLDSVASVKVCDYSKPMKILDLGTGAGFPGIPLKIAFPDQEIVLLDSLNKRVKFLNTVIETLGLTGIRAIHGRAEDYARHADYREQFDLCVSRAVANLSTLSEMSVSCSLFVDRSSQIQHLNDSGRSQIEVFTDDLYQFFIAHFTGSCGVYVDGSRMCHTDRIRQLDLTLVSQTCCYDILCNITCCV